jgi:hypothetical protein
VMKEAIRTWSWPLDRRDLNIAIKEFFHRIPSEHQRTIYEIFGWEGNAAGKLRFDEAAVLHKLAALDDDELARFLMLCSFAHYGANQYGNSRADQKLVVKLSQERGVNYELIDGQVRAELSPRNSKLCIMPTSKWSRAAKWPKDRLFTRVKNRRRWPPRRSLLTRRSRMKFFRLDPYEILSSLGARSLVSGNPGLGSSSSKSAKFRDSDSAKRPEAPINIALELCVPAGVPIGRRKIRH